MLKIRYNIKNFVDIISMADFYERVGIKKGEDWLIDNISEIKMNRKDCEQLLEYLKAN